MRREVYSKMLKKRQQKPSIRLCDGVAVREWMEYKSHHYVNESRTFSKRPTWCKLMITSIRRALAESSHELILRHSPQALMTRIVRKLYPRNLKHIRNKLRCDRNTRTSNVSKEERYWTINPVHVGVKLLNGHERTSDRDVTQWLPFLTVNDSGKVSVGEVHQYDLVFRMNTSSRKVLRECLVGIIITEPKRERGRIRRRIGIGMKRVSGRSGFTLRCHGHD